jgi:hypothetical protein
MRKGTPVASDLASFLIQSSLGISSSQPLKVTAKASLTASVTGYCLGIGAFIRVFQYQPMGFGGRMAGIVCSILRADLAIVECNAKALLSFYGSNEFHQPLSDNRQTLQP